MTNEQRYKHILLMHYRDDLSQLNDQRQVEENREWLWSQVVGLGLLHPENIYQLCECALLYGIEILQRNDFLTLVLDVQEDDETAHVGQLVRQIAKENTPCFAS